MALSLGLFLLCQRSSLSELLSISSDCRELVNTDISNWMENELPVTSYKLLNPKFNIHSREETGKNRRQENNSNSGFGNLFWLFASCCSAFFLSIIHITISIKIDL